MNQPNAITELQRLAEQITEHDIAMMISHGGKKSVYEFIQLAISMRISYLQHQREDAA